MREAVLEELGLMPLWQLRSAVDVMPDVSAPDQELDALTGTELTVITVLREDGAPGWVLMGDALADEAAVLFTNMLGAMRLRQSETRQVAYAQLNQALATSRVQWVWGVGETAAALETGLPVFVSVHPRELVSKPQLKSEVWANWCSWLRD